MYSLKDSLYTCMRVSQALVEEDFFIEIDTYFMKLEILNKLTFFSFFTFVTNSILVECYFGLWE